MPDLNRSLLSEGENADTLGGLTDVSISTPEEFQSLVYNGTGWVNGYAPLVSYVQNAEANTLTTGTVVYLFGGTGDHASVKRADYSSDTTSSKTIGVVGANIAASQNGPVVTRGYVDGIDLSVGYSVGDVLWLGDDGQFTTTKATSPNHLVFIGVVVRASNNGIIYVATQNGYELDELHNVALANVASGDFLKYNGSLWINDAINLGTDTVGNYVSDVSSGTLITVSHTPGEGSTATVNLSNGSSGQIILANATGVPTYTTVSGDATITNTGNLQIASNSIVNADVNSAAAIALSKLASGSSAQIIVANATGVPTYVALSGDATITNAGNLQIAANAISNADISTTAAIQLSKLASGSSAQIILANATGVPTYTTLSGDIAVDSSGAVTIAANSVALGTDTTGNYIATIAGTTNEISVSGSGSESAAVTIGLPANVTIANNLTVTGNLTVSGTTTTVNTATLSVADNIVTLNSDFTAGAPTENAGIEVLRGSSSTVAVRWNETNDKWEITNDGTTYGNVVSTVDSGTVTSAMIANGTIVNADISASAAIDASKLATTTAGNILIGNLSGVPTFTTVSGDISLGSDGNAQIAFGSIVNSDVSASAAIALNKLASGSSGQIILANAGGAATYTTVSGDVTITNTGNVQIAANAISNADISTTAAIQLSKLASGSSGQVVIANATGVPTYVSLSGDVTVAANGLTTIAANSVTLGTDTIGDYVANITATGSAISISNGTGEGSSPVISFSAGLDDLSDVDVPPTMLSPGYVLQYNGSAWVGATVSSNPLNSNVAAIFIMDIGV